MPKKFEHKEAKEQIAYFKKLIANLKNGVYFKQQCLADLRQRISILLNNGYFSSTVKLGIDGQEIDLYNSNTKSFLTSIFNFIEATKYSDLCSSLYDNNVALVETLVSSLSSGTNALFWFFSSKKKKENAEFAYEKLYEMRQGDFVVYATEALNKIQTLEKTDYEIIRQDYLDNPQKYKEWLQKSNKVVFTENGLVPLFKSFDTEYKEIQGNLGEIQSSIDDSINEIKASIDRLIAEELVAALRGISVEELARDKSGIKTKYLKDAGYDNLADIFGASTMQIASVYGISQDKAYTIKSKCDNYAKKIRSGLKIKLSVDNKSKTATKVVQSIYTYMQKTAYSRQVDELNANYGNELKNAFSTLYRIENGIKWLFIAERSRNQTRNAFQYIKETLSTTYKAVANEIYKGFRNKSNSTSNAWNDFAENSIRYYNVIEEVYPGVLGTDDSIYGLPEELARQIQDECFFPDGLLCTLRKYQEWGVKYILHQERVLLGDEMGLGKTIQAIATMVSLKNTGATHFLVVCPASVVTNWCREVTKHSKLRVTKIHGAGKIAAFKSWLKTGGVAVTNYESTSYIKLEPDYKLSLLVVDEAHYIKNANARRSVNTRALALHADRILFMTGTALENNVNEMISLIEVLRPSIASQIESYAFMSAAPQFREKIAPVYYRRKREDVLTELPDKIESKEWCLLSHEEEELYEDAVLESKFQEARRVSWNVDDLNHSCKAQRLKEIIEEAEAEGRKVLVFSFFLDTIAKIHDFLRGKCLNPITGSVNVNRRQEIIDEFDRAPAGTVLLAQINSGGTGLNIQSASVVIICEPQFKPSIENQAISRAYRMGQSRNVLVYRLLCENTIDERLMEVLEEKQQIFDAFADKSVAAQQSIEIDEKTFGQIIKEEIDRINKKRGTPLTEHTNNEEIQNATATTSSVYTTTAMNKNKKTYYETIMKMQYDELVRFLIDKYGPAKYDYFVNESCSSKNKKVSRTKEGLYCHHIDEDKAIMLSNDKFAINNPFEYQKANRLVYCNILEHFLLHILIVEAPKNTEANKTQLQGIGGAVNFICKQLNDTYCGYNYTAEWMQNIVSAVKNDYDSYIVMLKRLWQDIQIDPVLSSLITKSDLAKGWENNIYEKVLQELD